MASPLPNTNAPASVKYQAIRHSSPGFGPRSPATSQPNHGAIESAVVVLWDGSHAFAISARRPQPRNTHRISFSVHAVTSALATRIRMSSGSLPTVRRPSLTALRAMIAITAAPMP